ncbi:MAG: ferritin-like domain-containing protein [Gemmatimonadaceae bacterium]|nr:ferritin-like domain-containing protein [Gemmatimonadaceae bacterium]
MSDKELVLSSGDQLLLPATRRKFLKVLGVGGAVVLMPGVFAACNDNNNGTGITPGGGGGGTATSVALDLSTDAGILNFAYALEQLEAAYYTAALTSPGFAALSSDEKEVLTDLQKHEVIHREWFKQVLGTNAIGSLGFNSATVATLTASRAVLLSTSQLLEDTGVSAYNGAGKYLKSPTNLLLAGKIVSVEARHAAAIRDMRDTTGRLFAGDDVVNPAGLDVKLEPSNVLANVASLNVLTTTISISAGPAGTATPNVPVPNPT